jgi:hypothetical protein
MSTWCALSSMDNHSQKYSGWIETMSLYGTPSTYIPPTPGIHYVGPASASFSPAYTAPQAYYYNVNSTYPAPAYPTPYSSYTSYPAAYPPVYPPAYPAMYGGGYGTGNSPVSNDLYTRQSPPSPGNPQPPLPPFPPTYPQGPVSPTEMIQKFAEKQTQTGVHAFIRGGSITLIPALVLGVISAIRKPGAFSSVPNALRSALGIAVITLLAMGVGGSINAGWAFRDKFKAIFFGKRVPEPMPALPFPQPIA